MEFIAYLRENLEIDEAKPVTRASVEEWSGEETQLKAVVPTWMRCGGENRSLVASMLAAVACWPLWLPEQWSADAPS